MHNARRGGGTIVEARRRFWMVDGAGLVTRGRADAEQMPDHLLPYCHEGGGHPACPDLASAVAAIKPSVLIGISDGAASLRFGRDVVEAMAAAHARPIILPLSYPGCLPLLPFPGSTSALTTCAAGFRVCSMQPVLAIIQVWQYCRPAARETGSACLLLST